MRCDGRAADRGPVRIATPTRLEIGFCARSGADLRLSQQRPAVAAVPTEHPTPAAEERAVERLRLPG